MISYNILASLRRNIFIPLWVFKDRSPRLKSLRTLEHSQFFSSERLKEEQFARLTDIISHAYRNTDFYRRRFDESSIQPESLKDEKDIAKIPLLTKADLRDHGPELVSRKAILKSLIPYKTGGSTGKPVTVYHDFDSMERYIGSSLRAFKWSGWKIGEPMGRIWGNPPQLQGLKPHLRNLFIEPKIYLDTMRLDAQSVADFAVKWRKLKPTLLHGHAHSLFIFAEYCRELGITDLHPRAIISTSMMLLPHERAVIEDFFGLPVTNFYGCEEVSLIASECEQHNGMHINMDNNFVEIVDSNGNPAPPGQEGAIVITSLNNRSMPIIRYKIEDMGVLSDRVCACGRNLPLLEKVTGRIADFLTRKDGSLVAGVSLVERTVTAIPGINQMQIVQEDFDTIVLNIAKNLNFTAQSQKNIENEFRGIFGEDTVININFVSSIAQERNGKYRFSISKIGHPRN